jgi:hypothetical protein
MPRPSEDYDPDVERLRRSFRTRAAVLVALATFLIGSGVLHSMSADRHDEVMERIRDLQHRVDALHTTTPDDD